MPQNVVERSLADYVERAERIGPLLQELVMRPDPSGKTSVTNPIDPGLDEMEQVSQGRQLPPGELSPITCPECKGPLWLKENGSLSHFRCHTGHAFTGEVLLACQKDEVEAALWSAVRALDEQSLLLRRLCERESAAGPAEIASRQSQQAAAAETHSNVIRGLLLGR
jgi:two-component system chemotaxis response regulator CheB